MLLSLFSGYTIKVCALGASPADAAVVLVLAAAHFCHSYHSVNKQISQLNQEVNNLTDKLKEHSETLVELKSSISSAKLAAGMSRVK